MKANTKWVRQNVKNYLHENHLPLENRLPHKEVEKIQTYLNQKSNIYTSTSDINSNLSYLRKKSSKKISKAPWKKGVYKIDKNVTDPIMDFCRKNNLDRGAPPKEENACKKLIYAILNILPRGGFSVLFGTETPFASSKSKKFLHLQTNNQDVAIFLKHTSERMAILIGNLVNKIKAELKCALWKSLSSTCTCDIYPYPLDYDSVVNCGEWMAKNFKIAKMVIMHNGSFDPCQATKNKYNGININFKRACEYLSTHYNNLHILIMKRRTETDPFGFEVLYFNSGTCKKITLK